MSDPSSRAPAPLDAVFTTPLTPVGDPEAGVCTDGVCTVPGPPAAPAEPAPPVAADDASD